jgi:hypothetical protein
VVFRPLSISPPIHFCLIRCVWVCALQHTQNDADGAHWWIDGSGSEQTFSCNGYNCQRAIAVPKHKLVVVRLGVSPDNEAEQGANCTAQIGRIVSELCARSSYSAAADAKL